MVWTRLPEGAEDEANQAEALQEEGAVEVDDSRPEAPPHASGVVLLLPLPAGLRPGGHLPPPPYALSDSCRLAIHPTFQLDKLGRTETTTKNFQWIMGPAKQKVVVVKTIIYFTCIKRL